MKTVETKIMCDSCQKDISPEETSYPAKFILRLSCENVALHQQVYAMYAIIMHPPIKNDLYFCGIECMKGYDPKRNIKE